jgi:glycosyltransferase involved in cell wall biosynthesis
MSKSSSSSLVSVVIPTYNRGDCIERTIDSALGQTHQNVEILVVDDGSTDDTRQRIERRYGLDAHVRYLHQQNQGVPSWPRTATEYTCLLT